MSVHAPVFLANKMRGKTKEEFTKTVTEDVKAVITLLYKRGMWSKFHYDKWMSELEVCSDEVFLHAWWDAIVNGAMFELEVDELAEFAEGHSKFKGLTKDEMDRVKKLRAYNKGDRNALEG